RNAKYRYTYDLLNRKLSLTYPDRSHEDGAWDAVSNLATYSTRANSKGTNQIRSYTYDERNREIHSEWTDGTPAIDRTYDVASRLLTMTSSVSSLAYTYDDANQLTSESQTITGGGPTKIVGYDHNLDGLRRKMTYPSGTVVSYIYTGRNQ